MALMDPVLLTSLSAVRMRVSRLEIMPQAAMPMATTFSSELRLMVLSLTTSPMYFISP